MNKNSIQARNWEKTYFLWGILARFLNLILYINILHHARLAIKCMGNKNSCTSNWSSAIITLGWFPFYEQLLPGRENNEWKPLMKGNYQITCRFFFCLDACEGTIIFVRMSPWFENDEAESFFLLKMYTFTRRILNTRSNLKTLFCAAKTSSHRGTLHVKVVIAQNPTVGGFMEIIVF